MVLLGAMVVIVVIVVVLVVGLVELVQVRSGTLCINCRYLSHYLSVVRVRIVLNLVVASAGLVWTDFRRTLSSVLIVVFTLAGPVGR